VCYAQAFVRLNLRWRQHMATDCNAGPNCGLSSI
jgi:hypothetical protein